jgi:hypothetical protein
MGSAVTSSGSMGVPSCLGAKHERWNLRVGECVRVESREGDREGAHQLDSPSTLSNGGTTLGDQQAHVYHPYPAEERPQLDLDVNVRLVTICRVLPAPSSSTPE